MHTAICIPSYRRPQSLERLLHAVAALDIDSRITVIVADNDSDQKQGLAVCAALKHNGYTHELVAIEVPERGISSARNALIATVLARPEIDCLAMIDDDEWPDALWLRTLINTLQQTGADIAAGPVRSIYAAPIPDYMARANKPPRSHAEGIIDFIDSTSNILFRSSIFRETETPWFNPLYALIGGGDKEFLWRMKQRNKRFAWSPEAWVNEEMPETRCTVGWALQRAYRIGNSDMLLKLRHRSKLNAVAAELVIIPLAVAGGCLMAAAMWSQSIQFSGRRHLARSAGKIAAIRGKLYQEYSVLHGQ